MEQLSRNEQSQLSSLPFIVNSNDLPMRVVKRWNAFTAEVELSGGRKNSKSPFYSPKRVEAEQEGARPREE